MTKYNEMLKIGPHRIVDCTTATLAVNAGDHDEKVILLGAAAITATLPPATGSGAVYTFFTTVQATAQVIQVTATDTFGGGVAISEDIAGVTMLCAVTSDTLTMNGTTKGGLVGSHATFTDVASGKWMVEGFLAANGNEATPWSADVS